MRFWVPLLYLAVPLLLWQALVWFGQVLRPLLASPVEALTSLTTRWAVIAPHAAASFRLVALALPLALALAYILACCMWLSGAARAVIMPALVVLVALPVFVLGRVLSFWFGLDGIAVKVTILVLILTFPVTLALTLGMEHLPRETLDAAAIDGRSRAAALVYPAALGASGNLSGDARRRRHRATGALRRRAGRHRQRLRLFRAPIPRPLKTGRRHGGRVAA